MLRRWFSWESSPRLTCGAVVAVFGISGYFFFNQLPVAERALVPLVPAFDSWPVWPWTVVGYVALYPLVALSIALLPDESAARRAAAAWLASISMAYIVFALWPTRIERDPVPPQAFLSWSLELVRRLDEPHTCFPSLHVTHCALGVWAAWPTRWRWGFGVAATLIVLSTLTTDQHYFLDLPAGALAALLGIALSRGLLYKSATETK